MIVTTRFISTESSKVLRIWRRKKYLEQTIGANVARREKW